jgi:hypothetical protein
MTYIINLSYSIYYFVHVLQSESRVFPYLESKRLVIRDAAVSTLHNICFSLERISNVII